MFPKNASHTQAHRRRTLLFVHGSSVPWANLPRTSYGSLLSYTIHPFWLHSFSCLPENPNAAVMTHNILLVVHQCAGGVKARFPQYIFGLSSTLHIWKQSDRHSSIVLVSISLLLAAEPALLFPLHRVSEPWLYRFLSWPFLQSPQLLPKAFATDSPGLNARLSCLLLRNPYPQLLYSWNTSAELGSKEDASKNSDYQQQTRNTTIYAVIFHFPIRLGRINSSSPLHALSIKWRILFPSSVVTLLSILISPHDDMKDEEEREEQRGFRLRTSTSFYMGCYLLSCHPVSNVFGDHDTRNDFAIESIKHLP